MKATSKGPTDVPKFPPTWKMDWAKPRRPWLASDVMREASGWRVDEPMPTRNTAINTAVNDMEYAKRMIPAAVKTIPSGRLPT